MLEKKKIVCVYIRFSANRTSTHKTWIYFAAAVTSISNNKAKEKEAI